MKPIVYVTSEYPAVAHTFVLREVIELRKLGAAIHTVSVHQPKPDATMSGLDEQEHATTKSLRPARIRTIVRAWLAALRSPGALGHMFRRVIPSSFLPDADFSERLRMACDALLLWHHCTLLGSKHIHAHFANEANDIGRLATYFGNLRQPDRWIFTFTMHGPTAFFDVHRHAVVDKVNDANGVTCISHHCKAQMLSIGADADKLHVSHLGTDLAPLRELDRLHSNPCHIVCVGRLVEKKAHESLVRAIGTLASWDISVRCTIIGDGPLRPRLQQLISELQLNESISLVGARHQEYVTEALRTSDIFCLPSLSEGLPVALMEALSWQVPVVATNIAGIPELITNEVDGLLVTPAKQDDLVDALRRMIQDRQLQERLADAGRLRIEHHFNASAAAERMGRFLIETQLRQMM